MTRWMGIAGLMFGLAACGGPTAAKRGDGESKTAADENAPAPPDDEAIKKHQEAEQAAPKKKLSVDERQDFDAAVARWEAAKKAGPIGQSDCRTLSNAFESVASSHKTVAAQAHFNAGTILDGCGLGKEAEAEYKNSLDINPAYGPSLNNLGELYYRQGNPTTARMWFEKGIAADPTKNAPAYTNLGVLLYQQARESGDMGAFNDAISKLRRALAIDNDSMAAYNTLALIYYAKAENDRSKLALAELVCKQAKETNDKYAPIYNTLGLIQLRKKNVTQALKEFEHAVELNAGYVEAHLNIGAIGLSSRQYEKAEQSFRTVMKLQPNNIDATVGLGVALRGQKKIDEAEEMYKKAAALDPKSCAVPYNLGVLYQDYKSDADNKNLKQAQQFYNQYVSCGRTEKSKLADAQRRIKDIDETFVALEQQKANEAEMKKMQEESDRQQKALEEQQKAQAEKDKAAAPPAGDKAAAPAPAGDKKPDAAAAPAPDAEKAK